MADFDQGVLSNAFAQRASFGIDGSIENIAAHTGADVGIGAPKAATAITSDFDPSAPGLG